MRRKQEIIDVPAAGLAPPAARLAAVRRRGMQIDERNRCRNGWVAELAARA
jgi:hypothetical protein